MGAILCYLGCLPRPSEDTPRGSAQDIEGIVAILKATEVAGTKVGAFEDFIVGHGELWSARMIAFRFQQQGANAVFMDARDVLVVRPTETGEDVDVLYAESAANLNAWGTAHGVPAVIVCTGFIARTDAGRITTLKRNGSDYTATIMGALLQANAITIWTDVNGVYSADPRKVKDAQSLEMLSYNEAWELAYFGANVLHPRSTIPAMRYRIPIVLRNIFDLSAKGSVITTHEDASGKGRKVSRRPGWVFSASCACSSGLRRSGGSGEECECTQVKGFATVDGVSLIEVMGTGMVGVPGTASAIFGVMRDNSINVIIISQASSEHSVSVC